MTDQVKECRMHEDGKCVYHGVEVERRQHNERDLDAAEKHIGTLLTFKNQMIGISFLGVIVLLGGYAYTSEHIQSSERKYEHFETEFKAVKYSLDLQKDTTSNMREVLARSDARTEGINSRLSSIDARLAQMVGLMLKAEKITPGQIMDLHKRE